MFVALEFYSFWAAQSCKTLRSDFGKWAPSSARFEESHQLVPVISAPIPYGTYGHLEISCFYPIGMWHSGSASPIVT